jgi:spore maturation protein CgeB
VFFEKDVSYYASTRDMTAIPGCELRLYAEWQDVASEAHRELQDADAGIVTSYCPHGAEASLALLDSSVRIRCFYDLDTPVTLSTLLAGGAVPYLPRDGLGEFDMVLSYTGGEALRLLQQLLNARNVAPLYGSVDPEIHRPAERRAEFEADLSYLGTYAADRQETLDKLFIRAARVASNRRFLIGGAQYPDEFPWTRNTYFVRHLPPDQHPAFYCSSLMTLNVTRRAMAEMGYCPSGRLFEAAACGAPILTDKWEGLESFYTPKDQILVCRETEDVLNALELSEEELRRMARNARERTLAEHTADHRAIELERILEDSYVGHNPGSRERKPYTTARVLEGTAAGGQPV